MSKEAMKLALEALESCGAGHISDGGNQWYDEKQVDKAITALREALAEQPAPANLWLYWKVDDKSVVTGPFKTHSKDEAYGLDCIDQTPLTVAAPQPAQQQEPTKAMINAAERIDWSDSDVRGNIVNMWQAMCAAAPQAQPAQQEPVAWGNFKEDGTLVGLSQHPEDQANWTGRKPLYTSPQPAQPAQPAQQLPFGVGGGLVAIKTLLSRDPCAHAKVAIEMIDAMLSEQPAQQQEPVAYAVYHRIGGSKSLHWSEQHSPDGDASQYQLLPLYTSSPPQRKPLTDEEIEEVWRRVQSSDFHDCVQPFARAIEAAHGIKENT